MGQPAAGAAVGVAEAKIDTRNRARQNVEAWFFCEKNTPRHGWGHSIQLRRPSLEFWGCTPRSSNESWCTAYRDGVEFSIVHSPQLRLNKTVK
jgi:hypothetical protein